MDEEQIPLPTDLEIFKIGRMRILFPPDITEDEFQFMSMILYSYIQTVKYKSNISNPWKISERLEERKNKNKNNNNNNNNNKKNDEQAGVS